MRRSWAIVPIGLVCVVGGTLLVLFQQSWLRPRQLPAPAPTVRAVTALGRIRPENGIIEVGADASRRVARLLVEEGQAVTKDEVLAYLDSHEELQAAAALAEAQCEGGKAQLASRTVMEQASIARAGAELKMVLELAPLEKAIQELTVAKGRSELELVQKELQRLEKLVDKGSVTREDVDRKTAEATQRMLLVKSAEEELRRLKSASDINHAKAQANLDLAVANLKYSQASIDVESLGKSAAQARSRLNSAIVRAPAAGHVLKVRCRPGEQVSHPGILTLANLDAMGVVAEVHENDLLRVHEDQTVRVTAAALTEPLTGRVVRVSRLIDRQTAFDLNPTATTDARVAAVHIRLDRAALATRLLNLQVTVIIDVEPRPHP